MQRRADAVLRTENESPGASPYTAFLVSEADFDAVFGPIQEQRIRYWAEAVSNPAQKCG